MNSVLSLTKLIQPCPAVVLGAAITLATAMAGQAQGTDNRAPDVPDGLDPLTPSKVQFHAYAVGVQIYTWVVNPTNSAAGSWVFVAPEAVLYDADDNIVGSHYAGPTWESNSGSKVRGSRIQGANVDSSAIPWLLLGAAWTQGNGIFANVNYVQRVNTFGGMPPLRSGSAGEVVRMYYEAEYFFYRPANSDD